MMARLRSLPMGQATQRAGQPDSFGMKTIEGQDLNQPQTIPLKSDWQEKTTNTPLKPTVVAVHLFNSKPFSPYTSDR